MFSCLFSHPYKERASTLLSTLSSSRRHSERWTDMSRGRAQSTQSVSSFSLPLTSGQRQWSLKSAYALFIGLRTELFYWKLMSQNRLSKCWQVCLRVCVRRWGEQVSQLRFSSCVCSECSGLCESHCRFPRCWYAYISRSYAFCTSPTDRLDNDWRESKTPEKHVTHCCHHCHFLILSLPPSLPLFSPTLSVWGWTQWHIL